MKNTNYLLLSTLALIAVLTGCAHYSSAPLTRLSTTYLLNNQSPDLLLACKAFTKADCLKFLDRDVIAAGYQPVHVTIINNSQFTYIFSTDGIDVPHVPAREVAEFVHTSTGARVATYGIIGLFIWPFLIPAIVDGFGSSKANRMLDNDFLVKELKTQLIYPYTTVNGLLFVPNAYYRENFKINLVNEDTKERKEFLVRVC